MDEIVPHNFRNDLGNRRGVVLGELVGRSSVVTGFKDLRRPGLSSINLRQKVAQEGIPAQGRRKDDVAALFRVITH